MKPIVLPAESCLIDELTNDNESEKEIEVVTLSFEGRRKLKISEKLSYVSMKL